MERFLEYAKFRCKDGLNQLEPGKSSQNGQLFTLSYLIDILPELSPSMQSIELERVEKVFSHLENPDGIHRRHSSSTETNSMDNTAAIIALDMMTNNGFASRMLKFARNNSSVSIDPDDNHPKAKLFWRLSKIIGLGTEYCWNARNPELFHTQGWWGRSPGMMSLIKYAAGKWLTPWDIAFILIGQFIGLFADKGNTNHRILPWVTWHGLMAKNKAWKLPFLLWNYILKRQYTDGITGCYRLYYRFPTHPIKRLTPTAN